MKCLLFFFSVRMKFLSCSAQDRSTATLTQLLQVEFILNIISQFFFSFFCLLITEHLSNNTQKQSDATLRSYCSDCVRGGHRPLADLLIMPFQRACRYPLLVRKEYCLLFRLLLLFLQCVIISPLSQSVQRTSESDGRYAQRSRALRARTAKVQRHQHRDQRLQANAGRVNSIARI